MQFDLTPEQRMLVDTVRRFVATELLPLEEEIETTGRLDPEKAKAIFAKSRELGFYAMNIPEQYGGGGLSAVDTMLAEEQFGHAKDILIRRAFGNVYESLLEGTDEQKRRWLLPTVRGERTCSIAITEPGAGSDAASITTRAMREGERWKLFGQKHFVSDGLYSDFFIVSAVTSPEARPRHVSLFLVDKDHPGVAVGRDQPMMGLTGTSHVELFFDGVSLGPEHMLGAEGRGLAIMYGTLGRVRLAQVGARAIGKASRLCTLMTDYANERKQFGQPIGEFQMVQQMIADSVDGHQRRAADAAARRVGDRPAGATRATGSRWSRSRLPRRSVASRTARCRCSAAWATAPSCRSSGSTAMRASSASSTAPRRSIAA